VGIKVVAGFHSSRPSPTRSLRFVAA
jgi:hypothetical protein